MRRGEEEVGTSHPGRRAREMQWNWQAAFEGSREARKQKFTRAIKAVDGFAPAKFRCVGGGRV